MPTLDRWDTSVTSVKPGEIAPRGRDMATLIEQGSWTGVLWLVLFGGEPSDEQEDALRRALIAAVDHGVAAPSAAAARITASTRVAPSIALAVGLITFAGPAHGGAAAEAGELLQEIIRDAGERAKFDEAAAAAARAIRSRGDRIPGFGHPYHPADPRVAPLMNAPAARRDHRDAAIALEQAARELVSPKICMNADVAVAALLLDVGLMPSDVNVVTALGRAVGLAAHVREEMINEKPFRAPGLDTVHFIPDDPGSGE